jgi:hypothetical protein
MSTDAPEPGDAFHRRSPRALSFEGPTWGVAPLASGVSPPHVIIDVDDIDQTPRPPVLTGWLGAACAPAASASSCLPRARPRTSRTSRPPGVRSGRLPTSTTGFPGSEGNRQKGSRSGAGEHRSSALPAAIARPGDFAPTLARFGRLLSRISAFRPVRRDAGRGGDRHRLARSVRRPAARLQGDAAGRAVRHRTSAKRPDVHQPEAPSIPRPFENERRSLLSAELSARCTSAFFTGRKRSRGTPASTRTARPTDADEP